MQICEACSREIDYQDDLVPTGPPVDAANLQLARGRVAVGSLVVCFECYHSTRSCKACGEEILGRCPCLRVSGRLFLHPRCVAAFTA
jgi:predicted RNA-binding Zn-ribbon protein involved in translation (DUF1610 family)